jgi:hypothetical protein
MKHVWIPPCCIRGCEAVVLPIPAAGEIIVDEARALLRDQGTDETREQTHVFDIKNLTRRRALEYETCPSSRTV